MFLTLHASGKSGIDSIHDDRFRIDKVCLQINYIRSTKNSLTRTCELPLFCL